MQWLVSAERLVASLRPPHAMGNIYIGIVLGAAAASLHCRMLPSWDTIKTSQKNMKQSDRHFL